MDQMVHDYRCSEEEIDHFKSLQLTTAQLEKLSKLTFILIANETFKLNQLEQVLSTPRQVQYWPCGEYHGTLWFG